MAIQRQHLSKSCRPPPSCSSGAAPGTRDLACPGTSVGLAHAAPLCARCAAPAAGQGTLPQGRHLRRAACPSLAAADLLDARRDPPEHRGRQLHRAALARALGAGRHAAQRHADRGRRAAHRLPAQLARAGLGEVRGARDQPAAARPDAGARHHARRPAAGRPACGAARALDRAAPGRRARTRDADPHRRAAARRQAPAPAVRGAAAQPGQPRHAGRARRGHRRQRAHRGAPVPRPARHELAAMAPAGGAGACAAAARARHGGEPGGVGQRLCDRQRLLRDVQGGDGAVADGVPAQEDS